MLSLVRSRLLCFVTLVVSVLTSFPAYAQQVTVTPPDAQTMLQNIAQQVPELMKMVTAFGFVIGMYMIISGIMKLKHVGESRTMMSHEHSVFGPILMISMGAMLLYLPTAVQVGMATFWTDPNPYSYLQQKDQFTEFLSDAFIIVQLVGVIAFIRGLIILSKGSGQSHQSMFAKGLTHIIGGIFCINIFQFVQVILATLGIEINL